MIIDPIIANPIWNGRNFQLNDELCFVIMPFNLDWSTEVFEHIQSIASKFNLVAKRADSVTGHVIMEDVWKLINEARIVIVDISDNNPNVFYELGIAHTLGKNIILLAQNTETIPFDISSYRHILYQSENSSYQRLEDQLSNHMQNIIQHSPTGNPIIDDAINKMNYWKTQGYDYDQLLKTGKLRILKKYVDTKSLPDTVLGYCLISSIYYGMADEMHYWTNINSDNQSSAEMLAIYILMPYRRPKFRSAFVTQYLSKNTKNKVIDFLKTEEPNCRFIGAIENNEIRRYVEMNSKTDPDLTPSYSKQLLNEFDIFEKLAAVE